MNHIAQITVHHLAQQLSDGIPLFLLDVREEEEVALCRLKNSVHIPMHELPMRHNELPDNLPIVVYCHHGIRSLNSALYLADVGFDNLINLQGGIDAWAREIEIDMARY